MLIFSTFFETPEKTDFLKTPYFAKKWPRRNPPKNNGPEGVSLKNPCFFPLTFSIFTKLKPSKSAKNVLFRIFCTNTLFFDPPRYPREFFAKKSLFANSYLNEKMHFCNNNVFFCVFSFSTFFRGGKKNEGRKMPLFLTSRLEILKTKIHTLCTISSLFDTKK